MANYMENGDVSIKTKKLGQRVKKLVPGAGILSAKFKLVDCLDWLNLLQYIYNIYFIINLIKLICPYIFDSISALSFGFLEFHPICEIFYTTS